MYCDFGRSLEHSFILEPIVYTNSTQKLLGYKSEDVSDGFGRVLAQSYSHY